MTQLEETTGQALLLQAEKQTKALKSILFRADLVLLLMLIAAVVSLGGAFR